MLNTEAYKDGAIDQIANLCESVTTEDAAIIGDIIIDTLTLFKADIINQISIDCISGVRDRLEQTLTLFKSA